MAAKAEDLMVELRKEDKGFCRAAAAGLALLTILENSSGALMVSIGSKGTKYGSRSAVNKAASAANWIRAIGNLSLPRKGLLSVSISVRREP